MKKTKPSNVRVQVTGKLAELPWAVVSRKQAPNARASVSGDIVYNVRSADDLGRALRRSSPDFLKI